MPVTLVPVSLLSLRLSADDPAGRSVAFQLAEYGGIEEFVVQREFLESSQRDDVVVPCPESHHSLGMGWEHPRDRDSRFDVNHLWVKVRVLGLEPKTYGLKVRCSTN